MKPCQKPTHKLNCLGPYQWFGKDEEVIFTKAEKDLSGVYLWTIPFHGKNLTYYVGETGRSFGQRLTENIRDAFSGLYRVYDPELFSEGTKVLIWEGMWKKGDRNRIHIFADRDLENWPHAFMRAWSSSGSSLSPLMAKSKSGIGWKVLSPMNCTGNRG